MNRKQKLIISITGITIVMLALLGLTYGYYLTRIQGNTNSNSISITTADLTLTYRDGTGELIATGVMPGNEITSKTFTVKNDGEQDVSAYTVALINIMNDFTFKDDLEVSVSCSSNINSGVCEGFAEDYEDNIYKETYPAVNSELFSLGIKENEIHTFTLTVDYLYQEFDQSDDMGKTLKGKVQIYDPKDTIEVSGEVTGYSEGDYAEIHSDIQTSEIVDGEYKFVGISADNHTVYIKNRNTNTEKSTTLEIKKGTTESTTNGVITFTDTSEIANVVIDATNTNLSTTINKVSDGKTLLKDTIMSDTRITKNTGTPDFTKMADYITTGDATSGEIGMYSAEDDYGTSWYFRGAQSYNYVNFAGFTWRIVRINGDGSIRLILNGGLSGKINQESSSGEQSGAHGGYKFNNYYQAIKGTYGFTYVYDNANIGYMYGSFLGSDYSTTHKNENDSIVKSTIDTFYEENIEEYNNYLSDTLFCGDKSLASDYETKGYGDVSTNYGASDRLNLSSSITPTLECDKGSSYNYSRYTSNSTLTTKNVSLNNDLNYPIALISIDEVSFAGLIQSKIGDSINDYLNKNNYLSDIYESIGTSTLHNYTMTPYMASSSGASVYVFAGHIYAETVSTDGGEVRPVINLRSDVLVDTGNGTESKPYTVKLPY